MQGVVLLVMAALAAGPSCPVGATVLVDAGATDGSYTETSTSWATAPGGAEAVGGAYRYLSASHGDGQRLGRATWTPTLPAAGLYQVAASFRATAGRTTDADYTVTDASGTTHHRSVDQTAGLTAGETAGPIYADLGTYYFAPGAGSVRLDGDDGASDAADAVIWTLKVCATSAPDVATGAAPCLAAAPGQHELTVYATQATATSGWSGASLAEDRMDGRVARVVGGAPVERLVATAFGVCDPNGIEQIEAVTLGVRTRLEHATGPRAPTVTVTAAGASATVSHTDALWDELDLTAIPGGWTWPELLRLTVAVTVRHPADGVADSGVSVDAVRLRVLVNTCTPRVARVCVEGDARWVDGCGHTGEVAERCDDLSPCTTDACVAGACVHTELSTPGCTAGTPSECAPGAARECFAGALFDLDSCGFTTALLDDCDDDDPCTTDRCEPALAACTHSLLATPACGGCTPRVALGCTDGTNVWLDSCGNIGAVAGSCDDGDPCTTDTCDDVTGECRHAHSGAPACANCPARTGKQCVGSDVRWVDGCGMVGDLAEACDDGDPCTDDACDSLGAVCTHIGNTTPGCADCSNGLALACVGQLLVETDGCVHVTHVLASCSDGDPCTIDTCNPVYGACEHAVSASPECLACPPQKSRSCSNGHVRWVDGCGKPGALEQLCDDGDPCTADTCDPSQIKCIHFDSGAPFCLPCVATGARACFRGAVISVDSCGAVAVEARCDDGDPCTVDTCDDAAMGCVHTPQTTPECQPCTPGASLMCQNNVLMSLDACGAAEGVVATCDDGDPCTSDVCAGVKAVCEHAAVPGASCLPCTQNARLVCDGGDVRWADSCGALGTVAEPCDDEDPCTVDACDPLLAACMHVPSFGAGCPVCPPTARTMCLDGERVAVDACGGLGDVVDRCTDGDPCTDDGCDPSTGACSHTPSAADECVLCRPEATVRCDGLALRWVDGCGVDGELALSCDDGDPCTADGCDISVSRCTHTLISPCIAEEPCTDDDGPVCDGGRLRLQDGCGRHVGFAADCRDGDPCTVDGCDPITATCASTPRTDADCGGTGLPHTACRSWAQLVCSAEGLGWVDACGQAVGAPVSCADTDPCTDDSCDAEARACVHAPSSAAECAAPDGPDTDADGAETVTPDSDGSDAGGRTDEAIVEPVGDGGPSPHLDASSADAKTVAETGSSAELSKPDTYLELHAPVPKPEPTGGCTAVGGSVPPSVGVWLLIVALLAAAAGRAKVRRH